MANSPVEVKRTAPTPAPTPAPAVPDVWRSFRGEMDRLFDRFGAGFGMPSFGRMFDVMPTFRTELTLPTPAVDITEDDAAYKVTAELPGMAEKDIEVALSDDVLTIKGEKTAETEKKDENTYLSERCYGAFQRSFVVPGGVDSDKIKADFAKGVLTVTLPKAAPAQKKTIEVKKAA
jgi:HSP20 family protein